MSNAIKQALKFATIQDVLITNTAQEVDLLGSYDPASINGFSLIKGNTKINFGEITNGTLIKPAGTLLFSGTDERI